MDVYEEMCHLVGAEFSPVTGVEDVVCPQMVRHWCECAAGGEALQHLHGQLAEDRRDEVDHQRQEGR